VDVYPETEKVGKQLKFASGRGIRFAVIIGESEREADTVTIKDLAAGDQQTLPRAQAGSYIMGLLNLNPKP
jgi:histidyl-tRNA synthetase